MSTGPNIKLLHAADEAKHTDRATVDEMAALISSWYGRKDQKYFDIDRPNTPLSKTDIERVSLNRLSKRFAGVDLSDAVLRGAFRKAIEERHTDNRRSIPVWSGDLICCPGNVSRMIWTDGLVSLNTWKLPSYRLEVPTATPEYGVVAEFLSWVIPRDDERRVFLDWLSWCLQNEADKPTWAPFFYSRTAEQAERAYRRIPEHWRRQNRKDDAGAANEVRH